MADIIYYQYPSGAEPVVGHFGMASLQLSQLPGTVNFAFQFGQFTTFTSPGSLSYRYRFVSAGWQGGAYASIRGTVTYGSAAVLPRSATWSFGPGVPLSYVTVGIGGELGHFPEFSYDNQYLPFVFQDSTQANAVRYGWVEVSLNIQNYPNGPNVTIFGYGYDDAGGKPIMGQVPEPTAGGLLVLGALAMGARGLRRWRQSRSAAPAD